MIIRRELVDLPVHAVGLTVIADIHQQVEIFAAHRFADDTFRFAGTETRDAGFDDKRVFMIAKVRRVIRVLVSVLSAPVDQIGIDFASHLTASDERDDAECADRHVFKDAFTAGCNHFNLLS